MVEEKDSPLLFYSIYQPLIDDEAVNVLDRQPALEVHHQEKSTADDFTKFIDKNLLW